MKKTSWQKLFVNAAGNYVLSTSKPSEEALEKESTIDNGLKWVGNVEISQTDGMLFIGIGRMA
jgi:hypothetical protein